MFNRDEIASKLGVEKLEDYIIQQYLLGKDEAEKIVEDSINQTINKIEEIDSDETKVVLIINQLIQIKSLIDNNDYFFQMTFEAKEYASSRLIKLSNETDELNNLARYVLDFYDFKRTSNFMIRDQLLCIKKRSLQYHIFTYYQLKTKKYFDILNDKYKVDNYLWNWTNFERGLIRVLLNHSVEKKLLKNDSEFEIDQLEKTKNYEIQDLNKKIDELKLELLSKNNEIEFRAEFHNKYYYDNQIIITDTYFGDNLPFLLKLFNFFKSNSLYIYGWSYFYLCMSLKNEEVIPLQTTKKLNFVGRIFYQLSNFLILEYKDEPFKFFKSKFLINESPITDSFKTNHMKVKFDRNDDSELIEVDDFFEKQKKIYYKM